MHMKSIEGRSILTERDNLLCSILQCGELDLAILDDVGYDLGEIYDELVADGIKPTLNIITNEIFIRGLVELENSLNDKLADLKEELLEYDEDSVEYRELRVQIDSLCMCEPENDVDWFCNCLDTSIWFIRNEEIYQQFLADEIKEIEMNMGFEFE